MNLLGGLNSNFFALTSRYAHNHYGMTISLFDRAANRQLTDA